MRYGYRRIEVLLRREGWLVNRKRVRRLYSEMGLQLRNKSPKRRVKAKLRQDRAAAKPNEVWAMDFVHDQLFDGRKIRILTIVDIFSRYAPAVDVKQSYRGMDVVETRRNEPHVLLDVSHLPADFLLRRFPTIAAQCRSVGVDLTSIPIPVVPAAHYTCGGVATDLKGRTDIDHLYAIGETAWTGLHGANRLASNSLLECVVFGLTAAADIAANRGACDSSFVHALAAADVQLPDVQMHTDADSIATSRHELRSYLWDDVGIVRSPESLRRAEAEVMRLQGQVELAFRENHARRHVIELRKPAQVAHLIVQSAQQRRESWGAHFLTPESSLGVAENDAVAIGA